MKVYVASAGFENCDAFTSVVGTTEDMVQEALDASIEETCQHYESDDESAEDVADTVWQAGPFAEDSDTLELSAAQWQELLGGWLVSFDAGDGSAVGHTNVLATEDEASAIYREWCAQYPNGSVTMQQVPPSVTYLDTP